MRLGYLGVIAVVLVVINIFLISRFFKVTAPTHPSTPSSQTTSAPTTHSITLTSSVPNNKFGFVNVAEVEKRIENLGIYKNGALLIKSKEKVPVDKIEIQLVSDSQPINLMMQTDSNGKSTSKHNFDQSYDATTKTLHLKVYTNPYIDYSEVDKQYSMAVALALFESAQTPPKNQAEQDVRTQRWLQYTNDFSNSGGQLVKRI